jgi:Cellulase (glycosyl hydrolase family 5)
VIRLKGINLSGLEYSRASIDPHELDEIASWGANFIRVPFNQRWLLDDPSYLDQLAGVAALAAERSLYTLFDLHWLDYGQPRGTNPDGSNVATPPLPDRDTPRAWALMAARFGADRSVMFDLLNEPHDRLPEDPFPLFAADGSELSVPTVGPAEWHPWVRQIAAAIRPHAPDTPLFVSGTEWGFRCVDLDLPGIVHAPHVYPYAGRRTRADWEKAFGGLKAPVVVTELGPIDDDLSPIEELFDFLDEHGFGWAAWSWRDRPLLVENGRPTAFGRLVRSRF